MNKLAILCFVISLFGLSGCSKYTMGFDERRMDSSLLLEPAAKSSTKILLLSDEDEKRIYCVDSPYCNSGVNFFKTGEVSKKLSCMFLKQYYEDVHSIPKDDLDYLQVNFPLMIYPKIVDYKYTVEYDLWGDFHGQVILDLTMNVKVFNMEKKVILDQNYSIDNARSEKFLYGPVTLIYLNKVLYKSVLDVLKMAKQDIDKLQAKTSQ